MLYGSHGGWRWLEVGWRWLAVGGWRWLAVGGWRLSVYGLFSNGNGGAMFDINNIEDGSRIFVVLKESQFM